MTWSEIALVASCIVGTLLIAGAIHPVTRPIVIVILRWGGALLVGALLVITAGVGLTRRRRRVAAEPDQDSESPVRRVDDEIRAIREETRHHVEAITDAERQGERAQVRSELLDAITARERAQRSER